MTRQTLGAQFVIGLALVMLGAFSIWGVRGIATVGLLVGVFVLASAAMRSARQAARERRGVDL